MTTRRSFLGLASCALAGCASRVPCPAVGRPTYHLFSRSFTAMDFDRLSACAAEAGYDGVEWAVRPTRGHIVPDAAKTELPKAAAAARRQGLSNVMLVTAFERPDEPYCVEVFRVAADCGFTKIRIGYQQYDAKESVSQSLARIHRNFAGFSELGLRTGVQAQFQNHDAWNDKVFGSAVWDAAEVLEDVDPRGMAMQYDVHHAFFQTRNVWTHGFDRVADRIGSFVLKDGQRSPTGGRKNCPAGVGVVPFKAFRERVEVRGVPTVPFSVHMEYYAYKDQKDVVETLRKELDWFKGVFR